MDQVCAAVGSASSSAATVLDRVFVYGGSKGRGLPTHAVHSRQRSFIQMLSFVVVMHVAWICNSLCCGAVVGTIGDDCCIVSFVVIERVMRLFSMISSFTLRTGCTLRGGCVCDGVGVAADDLVSTNLSKLRSLCLLLLLVMPFNAAIQSAMAHMILSAWVIVGLVMRL